jgi:hypothetical protein
MRGKEQLHSRFFNPSQNNTGMEQKTRAPIYLLIGSFLAYLVDQKLTNNEQPTKKQFSKYCNNGNNNKIIWIESLLQSPLSGYRKRCLWKIFAPYLMNVRKLSHELEL